MSDIKYNLFCRDSGRWVLSYVPKGGTWKNARQISAPWSTKGEKAAKAWAEGELAKIRMGGGTHPNRKKSGTHTLRDVHEKLMAVRADHPDAKGATIQNNWTHLRTQILGLSTKVKIEADPIADMPMADVDPAAARAFVRAVRKRNSNNHARNIFSTARMLWDVARAENIIKTDNPFRNELVIAELPKQRNKKGDGEPITVPTASAQALLDASDDVVPLQRRVRYCLAFTSGLDDGEIAGLTWGSLHMPTSPRDETTAHMRVRQAFALRGKNKVRGSSGTVQNPKTDNRRRDVPLHTAAVHALVEWREGWERLVGRRPTDKDFVFVTSEGQPTRPRSAHLIRADLRALNTASVAKGGIALLGEAQVAVIEFKATRRTFSSMLKDANVDREDRGKLMGHSGETVTERNYTRHELARLSGLIDRIPLRWGVVQNVVRTTPSPAQLPPNGSPESKVLSGRSLEARIGFEPTCDGFAKDDVLCTPQNGAGRGIEKHASGARHDNGSGERNGVDPDSGGVGGTTAGAGRATIVAGEVVVSTEVVDGEPSSHVAARLALALSQQGVTAHAVGGRLFGRQRGQCGGGS